VPELYPLGQVTMSKTSNQDFNDIRSSSTIGLALGAFVFLGLGFAFVTSIMWNFGGIIHRSSTETFGEWLFGLIISLVLLVTGLSFIIVGALCLYHFRLRRKLKRDLREKMSKHEDLA
jgi:hypothetical protein